jgi:hypothetical protein
MAKSTGIILVAGSITFVNEWLNNKINWKIVPATFGTALVFAGIEKLSEPAAVGLATIALISVLVGGITPGVPSPAIQILDTLGYGGTKK